MRYLGGKETIAQQIADFMQSEISNCDGYIEPFVGGFSVACRVKHENIICSDNHTALITLYKALQNGWIPPESVTEEEYKQLKKDNDVSNPLTAFVGFGLSFAGVYFRCYARCKRGDDYIGAARRGLFKKISRAQNFNAINFMHCDYTIHSNCRNMFIYCDPPYAKTAGYTTGAFDSEKFWEWCELMSLNNTVVISELQAPSSFKCVKEIQKRRGLRKSDGSQEIATEKLFMYDPLI